MNIDLSLEESEILLKSLDALEKEASQKLMMDTIFDAMLAPKGTAAELGDKAKQKFEDLEDRQRGLRETTVLLKAKIITARSAVHR